MEKYNLQKDEMVMVGDRIYTDIKLGENAGIDSILVLSGEAKREDLKTTEIKPSYIVDSVKCLYDVLKNN